MQSQRIAIIGAGTAGLAAIPYLRKEMAITISGLKTGLFTAANFDDIAKISVNH